MLLIVLLHIMQFGYDENIIISSRDTDSYIQLIIMMLGKLGVPGFVFITGYYGVRFKWNRAVSLWLQTTFYALLSIIGMVLIANVFSFYTFINCFIALFDGPWWFISDYFILMLLSIFLNKGIESADKKTFSFVIIFMVFILYGVMWFHGKYSAMSLLLFIFVYITGRYIALHPVNWLDKNKISVFCISLTILILLPIIVHYLNYDILQKKVIITYFNPFTLLCVVSLFLICKATTKVNNGNWLTKNILAVYLVHCSPFGVEILFRRLIPNMSFGFINVCLLTFGIFTISIIIEQLRVWSFKEMTKRLTSYIEIFIKNHPKITHEIAS